MLPKLGSAVTPLRRPCPNPSSPELGTCMLQKKKSMATQIMRAMGPTNNSDDAAKPMPSLPSPTLTNPDLVLPNDQSRYHAVHSPPRYTWRDRPPSPSYLREKAGAGEAHRERSGSGGSTMTTQKKEKRGLMSRKMMLLRSRTASSGVQQISGSQPMPRSVPSERDSQDYGSAYGSSPTLMDVGNLAPEEPAQKRISTGGSSLGSDDMAALPQFLAKYAKEDVVGTDDELEADTPASQKYGYSVTIEGGLQAQRRQQEEDEHNSAILSQRAEQILANAKKRLNVRDIN